MLDCCFSGIATDILQLADTNPAIAGQVNIGGAFVLASSAATRTAKFLPTERHTAFTGELISLLRDGVPEDAPLISLDSLYIHLTRRLETRNLPTPQKIGTGTTGRLALSRNISCITEVHCSVVTHKNDEDADEEELGITTRLIAVGSILRSVAANWSTTFPNATSIGQINDFPDGSIFHLPSKCGTWCNHNGFGFRVRACSEAVASWRRFLQYFDHIGLFCLGVKYEHDSEDPLRQLRLQLPGWNQFIPSRDKLARRMTEYDQGGNMYKLFSAHFNDRLAQLVGNIKAFLRLHYRALPRNPQYPLMPRLALASKLIREHYYSTWWIFVKYLGECADFCNVSTRPKGLDDVLNHLTQHLVSFKPLAQQVRNAWDTTEKILNSNIRKGELRLEANSVAANLTALGAEIESYLRLLLAEGYV